MCLYAFLEISIRLEQGAMNWNDENLLEDGVDEKNEYKIHEGIILGVILSPSMYDKMSTIFATFLNLLKRLIKTMPNSGLGLYVGNCSKEDPKGQSLETPEGVFRMFRLQDINQDMLKVLQRNMKNATPTESVFDIGSSSSAEKWSQILPSKTDHINDKFGHSLYTLFQQVLVDFNYIPSRTEEYTSRKMFLFTDCNTPFNGNQLIKQKLQSKLRDLNNSKITVYPFVLSSETVDQYSSSMIKEENLTSGVGLKMQKEVPDQLAEFKELFDYPLDMESKKYLPSINQISLDTLEEKIIKHATIRRLAFQCPLIFDDLKILVKGINPFTTVEWKKVKFYNSNNRLRYVKRKNIPTTNGIQLTPEEITKVYQVADQYIPIEKQIQSDCFKFGESDKPILHVIGTRKIKHFNPSYTVAKSLFMVAEEDDIDTHSLHKFAAIYKSLSKRNMMILCWGMPRKLSYPRFYYLIPTTANPSYGLSFTNYPQSLAMLELPYGNELRKAPDYLKKIGALKEFDSKHLLDDLIKETTVEKFKTFPNPCLSWNFQVMEDHILQVEIPKNEQEKGIELRQKQLELDGMYQHMLLLNEKIDTNDKLCSLVKDLYTRYNRISNFADLKRSTDDEHSIQQNSKKAKGSTSDTKLNDAKVVIYYKESNLSKCTNDMLKQYIKSKGGMIPTGRVKSEMISNIVEYLKNRNLI